MLDPDGMDIELHIHLRLLQTSERMLVMHTDTLDVVAESGTLQETEQRMELLGPIGEGMVFDVQVAHAREFHVAIQQDIALRSFESS